MLAARCFSSAPSAAQEPIAQRARLRPALVNTDGLAHADNWNHLGFDQGLKRRGALAGDTSGLQRRKCISHARREAELSLGGIANGRNSDVMFVLRRQKEEIAIKEANVLGIPVVAILDTMAIRLYCLRSRAMTLHRP